MGRWGEKACYEHLLRLYSDDPSVQVEWLNEETETGLPYVRDLRMRGARFGEGALGGEADSRPAPAALMPACACYAQDIRIIAEEEEVEVRYVEVKSMCMCMPWEGARHVHAMRR